MKSFLTKAHSAKVRYASSHLVDFDTEGERLFLIDAENYWFGNAALFSIEKDPAECAIWMRVA